VPASTAAGVFLFLDFLWPDPPCDRPILLTDSDSAYSDFHDNKGTAERLARQRVQGKANSLAAAEADNYPCPSACPNPQGSTASADITAVHPRFGPPRFGDDNKWWARADFNWFATVVCTE